MAGRAEEQILPPPAFDVTHVLTREFPNGRSVPAAEVPKQTVDRAGETPLTTTPAPRGSGGK